MKITQISVFLENKKGRLYEICSLLGKAKINIRALTIAESKDYGVIRMVVDDPQKAMKLFKKNSMVAELTDIVAVEAQDKPGGLAQVLKVLADNDVNVEYMYGFVEKMTQRALLVFRFTDTDKAIALLKKKKMHVIGKKDIASL